MISDPPMGASQFSFSVFFFFKSLSLIHLLLFYIIAVAMRHPKRDEK